MQALEIVGLVVAILTLLFGIGFIVNWWRRRPKIDVSSFHQAMDESYEVVVTVANGGDDDRHLEEIHFKPIREPVLPPGWAVSSAREIPIAVDLPSHGRPAKETLVVDKAWVDQRIPFRVGAKISARSRPIWSKKQKIDQSVLNVLEAP